MERRFFLKSATAFSLGFMGLGKLTAGGAVLSSKSGIITEPYGILLADPEGVMDLPQGFSYKIISRFGDKMDDGFLVPHRPDGMATFPGHDGRTVLIRNHEVNSDASNDETAFGKKLEYMDKIDDNLIYDSGDEKRFGKGGTTTVIFNTKTQRVENQFLSLSGTIRNCAGGPTPWNSWLTCEETIELADDHLKKDHGFIFEVPADAEGLVTPVPLKEMGRFNHEAIAVDPESGVIYLTEDRHDGLLYRFIPTVPGKLTEGGKLQALVVPNKPSLDTRNWDNQKLHPGDTMNVTWIDLDNVLAPEDDLRFRGYNAGAARFARGEGMWYGDKTVYFACTNGGKKKKGQIWKYIPSRFESTRKENQYPGRLELFVEPNDGNVIDNADNLTVSPWGDLIVCEDGSGSQYLVGITPDGEIYKFGRNALNDSELTGATFSPDGTTLFVNIQHAGLTLAITGPWKKRKN